MKQKKEVDYNKQIKAKFIKEEIIIFFAIIIGSLIISYLIYHFGDDKYESYQAMIMVGGPGIAIIRLVNALILYFKN